MEPEGSLKHSQVPGPIPSQLNPAHTPTSHFLKMHLNIIFPPKLGSPHWSLSLRFPHQNHAHASPLPHLRYTRLSAHSSQFYHPQIIWVRSTDHEIPHYEVFPLTCYLFPLRPKYSTQHPQPMFLPQCQWLSFTPIQNNRQNYSFV
jgi:hypothetical protein